MPPKPTDVIIIYVTERRVDVTEVQPRALSRGGSTSVSLIGVDSPGPRSVTTPSCATSPTTVEVRSAGSAPAETVNPAAVQAMREVGIDITDQTPKLLEYATAEPSAVIVTMGCGDACPIFPGKRYEDWKLEDPAGKGVEAVRPIRDEICSRVKQLLTELRRTA